MAQDSDIEDIDLEISLKDEILADDPTYERWTEMDTSVAAEHLNQSVEVTLILMFFYSPNNK